MNQNEVSPAFTAALFNPLPVYEGGKISPYAYNTGCGMDDDSEGKSGRDSIALLISDTTADEYNAYREKLISLGYIQTYENAVGGNLFAQLEKDFLVYIYFTANTHEVRIIRDFCSVPLRSFGYRSNTGSADCQIYQYGLYHDPQNGHSPTTTNCGMLYIVRLADNSLFMIDGGDLLQCSDEAVSGMLAFMRRITGVREGSGEKITISAWFISHAHNDHFCGCSKLLNRFSDMLKVERFFFNFPSSGVRVPDSQTSVFKAMLAKYCSDALFLKPHNGQRFNLANIEIEVLYAHEDALRQGEPSAYPLRDYNCTTTVLKMTVAGKSVMWLGDTNVEAENIIISRSSPEVWKSDAVQVAHHCFNYLSTLYAWIDADYAMLPNSYFGGHTPENLPKLADVICRLPSPDNIKYSDETDGFAFIDGVYTLVHSEPLVGGEYDFSGY